MIWLAAENCRLPGGRLLAKQSPSSEWRNTPGWHTSDLSISSVTAPPLNQAAD